MPSKAVMQAITPVLKNGGVGVVPTDTLYGIVGNALKKETVARIYKLRKRNPKKPMIILIGDMRDLRKFGISPDVATKRILKKVWPGKVSVILKMDSPRKTLLTKFNYLHRGTGTLAFRVPAPQWLRTLLATTGPLVAPSANLEGKPPARSAKEAKKYFGDGVDLYIDVGRFGSAPSTLVQIEKGTLKVLRKGAVRI